ncbi:unnamed protein product [Musa banksii]
MHALMVVTGFLSDASALRELLFSSAVSVAGAVPYALQLFDRIPRPDLFMWNTVIRGAAHTSTPSDAISLFARMERAGTRPDKLTFPFLLRACTKLSESALGSQFHAKITKFGLESDSFVRNALINMHANCGDLAVADSLFDGSARRDVVAWSALIAGYARRGELTIARQLFDDMPSKDLISWNVMITACAKRGEMAMARELFDRVPEKDVVSWNAMIAGYVQCGEHDQAMEVFEQMHVAGEQADEVTMLSLLSACADAGVLDIGKRIHVSLMEMCSRNGLSTCLGNALIDMYAKCGSIQGAMEVFRGLREKDLSTWNSIVGGLAIHGHFEDSLYLFEDMLKKKLRPDEITFVGVLVACSHGGMVEQGKRYFCLMQNEYGIEPNIKHYGCMVDMLGRAGLLKEAFEFIDSMKIEPNPIVWRALLGACRIHGDVKLAEQANEQLLRMRNDASGDFVLLSNIYASRGEWGGVEKVRKLMHDRGVSKEAGCTLFDTDRSSILIVRGTKMESSFCRLPFFTMCPSRECSRGEEWTRQQAGEDSEPQVGFVASGVSNLILSAFFLRTPPKLSEQLMAPNAVLADWAYIFTVLIILLLLLCISAKRLFKFHNYFIFEGGKRCSCFEKSIILCSHSSRRRKPEREMGRPPCCDKNGVKKGPWTPEEDIILVSYIQEHGPGNWRAVPSNTGLMRCSKSCRLRWTNYLRPGIKRGNFTDQEEKLIIRLQALLGNRWAAIASYLPERTDNDIKNYWNTHLKKKVRKPETGSDCPPSSGQSSHRTVCKGQWERCLQTDINMAKRALREASSVSCSFDSKPSTYASNTENISRLLQGWTKGSPKPSVAPASSGSGVAESASSQGSVSTSNCIMSPEPLESVFGFNDSTAERSEAGAPFSLLESWLLDEHDGHWQESFLDVAVLDTCELF